MRDVKCFAVLLPLAVCLASSQALAIKVTTGPDFDLNVSVVLQPRFQGDFDGVIPAANSTSPDGPSPNGHFNMDFYLKRARLQASGTAYKYFTFLVLLDNPNYGARGNYAAPSTIVQDLVISYQPIKDFSLDFGYMLMPLSHGSVASPVAQSAIDAPGAGLSGRLLNNAPRASRNAGLQIRTILADRRLLLRGGIYEGARATQTPTPPTDPSVNPNGKPLIGGMVRWNFIGDEWPVFPVGYPSIYIDGKTRASIGVGGHWQQKGAVNGTPSPGSTDLPDYLALAADAFLDIALAGDREVIFQLNGYRFDYGTGNARTGFGVAGDLGYRFGNIEPQVNAYWFNGDNRNTGGALRWAVGVNYFFKAHATKISAEFASQVIGARLIDTSLGPATPALHQFIVQSQLSF